MILQLLNSIHVHVHVVDISQRQKTKINRTIQSFQDVYSEQNKDISHLKCIMLKLIMLRI